MLFYNLTIIADSTVDQQALTFIKQKQADCPFKIDVLELLDSPHEGTTFSLQHKAADNQNLMVFKSKFSQPLQQELSSMLPAGQTVFFESTMKYIV